MSARIAKGVKFALIATDVIICLSGLIMLIAGSVVQGQITSQKLARTIGGYSTTSGSVICIIFGIAVLIFGAFGLYAAVKDHHRFLVVYSATMMVVFVIQFITGVVGLSVKNSDKFTTYVNNVFAPEFVAAAAPDSAAAGERDFYQKTFKCCGWNGTDDYLNGTTLNAPASCCAKSPCNQATKADLFADNCSSKIISASRDVISVVCGILVTFSIFNFISIVMSIVMSKQIKNGYQYT